MPLFKRGSFYNNIKSWINSNSESNIDTINFKYIFDTLPEAIAITDQKGNIKKVNREFEKLFNFNSREVIGKNIDTLITKGQYTEEAKTMTESIIRGEKVNQESIRFSKEGKPIPVSIIGSPILTEQDNRLIFVIYRNISELLKVEKELMVSEELFRLIFENSPLTIIQYNEQGIITACNKNEALLLGIDENNIIGFNLCNTQDTIVNELVYDSLKGKNGHFEGKLKYNKNKANSFIKIDTAPINSKTGEILGGIAMVENITKRKEAEIKLKIAKERAEEADRLKTSFLANMSHEIRTPMNAIIGFSDLLADPEITQEEKEEFITIVKNNGKHLLNIIDDIIDIAKIEAGQLNICLTQCPINDLLYELYTSFSRQIKLRKKLQVELLLTTGKFQNITILSDPFRLRQIFTNLLNNALKFTEKGTITFGFTIEMNKIQFFVKDTGIGIGKDKLNEIFDMFRQEDTSNTRKYGGTGLGLTISKNLVELLGGNMWVESEKGEGSAFYFSLPYQKISSSKPVQSVQNQDTINYNWENKVILIVEDDPVNYKFLEKVLRKTKAKVLWAENGKPAIEICKSNQPVDLILMDIEMPEVNGHEATKQIKMLNKNIPIIAQTAFAMSPERDKSLKAGCDDFISKPIKIPQLINKIHKYLN
ncbi:MAG: PAS domain S-box protein [Bacteroidales bacterium]|nr:PAS domain S-box protein [Bacteroidales bacterium]